MHTSLDILQTTFAEALLHSTDDSGALALFKGNPTLNHERFAYYRGHLFTTWENICTSTYPVLKQLVGEDFFRDLTRAYGIRFPSQSGDITAFGRQLPSYIKTLENCQPYPYLGDVAALEWLIHHAYYLPTTPPVMLNQLQGMSTEAWGQLRFQLQPSCFLFSSPFAVADIWQAHQNISPTFPTVINQPNYCLISRPYGATHHHVHLSPLPHKSYQILNHLFTGHTLEEALTLSLAEDEPFDLQLALTHWFNQHIFSAIF